MQVGVGWWLMFEDRWTMPVALHFLFAFQFFALQFCMRCIFLCCSFFCLHFLHPLCVCYLSLCQTTRSTFGT